MSLLPAMNALAVGMWSGMYLFTTLVVSPAFARLPWTPEERRAARSLVGRHYARVNGPLSLLALVIIAVQGVLTGWTVFLAAELLLLLAITALVTAHVRRARQAPQHATGWITHTTLACTALLCAAALSSRT